MRFRPIMMTTFAAMLGALPLAIGWGEGSELRRPLGITIIGGLLVSQVLTLLTTPVVYLYLDRFRRRRPAPKPTAGPAAPAGARGREGTPSCPRIAFDPPPLRRLAPLVALAALSACVVGPNYHRPATPTPPAFKEAQGWTPAQPADAVDRGDWWTVFNDPVLNDLEQRGRGLQPEPGRRRGRLPPGSRPGRRSSAPPSSRPST